MNSKRGDNDQQVRKVWIRGFSGVGKEVQTTILRRAFGTKVVGMSNELAGGDPSGHLCGEEWVRSALLSALEREGYFEDDGMSTVAIEGFFRTIEQTQWLPEMLTSRNCLDSRTAFVCLVTSVNEALFRMKRRYHQNLLEYHDPKHPRKSLRNEEYGSKADVYARFHVRVIPWMRDREKIRQILMKAAKQSGARMIDVLSGPGCEVEDVAVDLAKQLDWDCMKSLLVANELAETFVAPPEETWDDIPPVLVMPAVTMRQISENASPVVAPAGIGNPKRSRVVRKELTLAELHDGVRDSPGDH